MEVPESMLKFNLDTAGDHAARIFNPGAAISGYKANQQVYYLQEKGKSSNKVGTKRCKVKRTNLQPH